MAKLAQILDEMANSIRTAMEATDVDVQVEGRMILNPTPPTVDVYPGDPSIDPALAAFGEELGGELITVRVRVSTADHEAGQDLLLALMDDQDELSLVQAIFDDPTLNGTAASVHIPSRSGYALFPVPAGDGALLGCTFNVVVVKARS